MVLVADESIDRPIIVSLRVAGHQVFSIAESNPGASDDEVLRSTLPERALLLTADKDFGELVYRRHLAHTGVCLIRLSGLSNLSKATLVLEAVEKHGMEMSQAFTVIAPGALRIRKSI